MADTVVSDAMPGIQDEGLPNIADSNEDWGSAGLRMMLAQAVNSNSYIRSDSELTFTNHDGTNDEVSVTAGVAYLDLTGESVAVQSSLGGSSSPSYDSTLPTLPAIPVLVFSTVNNLSVQDSTLSQVWLAYATDDTVTNVSAGDIYFRSDDTGSVSAPPHPNVELGSANPDDSTADTLANRFGSPTFNATDLQGDLTLNNNDVTNVGALDTDDVDVGGSDFVSNGDFVGMLTLTGHELTGTTNSTSYNGLQNLVRHMVQFGNWVPDASQPAVVWSLQVSNNQGNYRIRNVTDAETISEQTNLSIGKHGFGPINYTPSTTGSVVRIDLEAKNDNGNTTKAIGPVITFGVKL